MFSRVVIGYDGSDHSKRALRIAIDLAKKYGSEVLVVTVIDVSTVPGDPNAIRIVSDTANQAVAEASEILSREGIPHRTFVRQGDPSAEIVRVAEENKADLVVVGSRGLSTLKRIILGSVSQGVLNRSKIPVLVVK
ncbi:MAG TPA: universal stress protein [Sulfolobales archaeon]|nr:universal stress protein [Sulfolobales archaeon]